ncbi:Cell division topological specificity factor [Desulfovibrionales bacterium]
MIRLLDYLLLGKRHRSEKSAAKAKERLTILLTQERVETSGHDYLPILKQELLQVICKYVKVDPEAIEIRVGNHDSMQMIELNVILPDRRRPTL